MGFDIGQNIQSSGITLDEFKKNIKKEKLKQKAESIFNKFNQNLKTNENGQQVLDKSEQANLMAFFKRIAGTETEDTSISHKDIKNAKKEGIIDDNISYSDMKKIMKSYLATLNENGTEDDLNLTFGENNQITASDDNSSTQYNINDNLQLTSETTTENGKETNSTTYTYNNNTLNTIESTDITEGGSVTTTDDVNGNTEKEVTKNGAETVTEDFKNKQKTVENSETGITTITKYSDNQLTTPIQTITINNNKNVVTVDETDSEGNIVTAEYSGNSESAISENNLTKQTIKNTKDNSTTVNEYTAGKLTTSTQTLSDETVITTNYGENGNKTLITENYKDGKSVVTNLNNHTKVTTGETADTTKTEVLNKENTDTVRTLTYNNSNNTATINETSFKTDKDGNLISYALYNGSYETLAQAASRLGLEEGTEAYNTFIQSNGGDAKASLRAGQQLKISQSIITDSTVNFNVESANVNRQEQINNWRDANPEKAAAAAAKKQGITDLRQTFATGNHKIFYSPTGETKSRVVGQGATGGTHYIYENGKLVNLETKFKLDEGEHIIRVTDDGIIRTNKNRYFKLDGQATTQSSYNTGFERGHAATGGQIKDVNGKVIGNTKISVEQGTPEEIKARQQKQDLASLKNDINTAQKLFDEQMSKDGWAADTADFVSKAWGWAQEHANNADAVRKDFAQYRTKLSEAETALQKGDSTKVQQLINELKSMNIVNRVAVYNQSQDDGAAAVKTTVVVAASTAAAVATGGSSLLVQGAVVGTAAAATRFAAETTDLASNGIDGDVSENLETIATQSLVEGGEAAVATIVLGGAFKYLKGTPKVTETGLIRTTGTTAETGLVRTGANTTEAGLVKIAPKVNTAGSAAKAAGSSTGSAATSATNMLQKAEQFLGSIKNRFSSGGFNSLTAAEKQQLAETLGTSVDDLASCSTKDIAKKLVMKFHPDRNPGFEEASKEVSHIISDIIDSL